MGNTSISNLAQKTATELNLPECAVHAVVDLLDNGSTVPFIARYRKEVSGGMDEVQIIAVRDRIRQLRDLEDRRSAIVASLAERNLLTDELKLSVEAAGTMAILEDVYLPFRPKRRTRATIAREKGLEPLAELIFRQDPAINPAREAARYADPAMGIASVEEALAGASDIIAEWLNEDPVLRGKIRDLFNRKAVIVSRCMKGKEEEGSKYRDYFDWQEPMRTAPSHRVLAMRRGENEGFLSLRVEVPEPDALAIMKRIAVRNDSSSSALVMEAAADSFKRLLSVSMETEVRMESRKKADSGSHCCFRRQLA